MTKETWINIAKAIDHLRIFPRLVLIGYATYVYQVTFFVLEWYSSQPKEARGIEESSVVGVVITAVTGFAPMIYRIYANSGTDWSNQPAMVTTSSTSTTTATGTP